MTPALPVEVKGLAEAEARAAKDKEEEAKAAALLRCGTLGLHDTCVNAVARLESWWYVCRGRLKVVTKASLVGDFVGLLVVCAGCP